MHNSSAPQDSASEVNTTTGSTAGIEGEALDGGLSSVYLHKYIIYGSLGALLAAFLAVLIIGAAVRSIKKKREASRKRSETRDTAPANSWVLMCHKDAQQRSTSWGYEDHSPPATETRPPCSALPSVNPPSRRLGHTRPSLSTFLATATDTVQRTAGRSAAQQVVGQPAGATVDLSPSLEQRFEEYPPPPPVFSDAETKQPTGANVGLPASVEQHLEDDLPPPPLQEFNLYDTVRCSRECALPLTPGDVAETQQYVQEQSLPWLPIGTADTYVCLQGDPLQHPPVTVVEDEQDFQDDELPPPPPPSVEYTAF